MQAGSPQEGIKGRLDILIIVVSVALFLFLISYPILLWESPERLIVIFLPMCIILWALKGIKSKSIIPRGDKWNISAGTVIIALSVLVATFFFTEYRSLLYERAANHTAADFIIGGIAIFLVILATWKTTGKAIPIVAFVFVFYAAVGEYFPGVLRHPGVSWKTILMFSAVDIEGIFGKLPRAGFSLVVIFVFFAGLVQGYGGLEYIINLSRKLLRRFKSGLPQVAVVSSLMFGSFSGSSAANVAGTGSFTIPMMKRFGIKPTIAGAIESVASTGGQVMPPVMGVAAFLMADFLNVHYIEIVARGFVPALVFYLCVAFSVYLITRRMLADTALASEAMWAEVSEFQLLAGLPILVAIGVLLFLMTYFRLSVVISGLYMVISFIVTRFIYDLIRTKASYTGLKQYASRSLSGIQAGAVSAVSITLMLATMGIVARGLVASGMAQKLSFFMVDFAGGNLAVLLLLVLAVCVLFGMAVSTLVAYILVVLLAAPALVQLGVALPVAHFTVFYLAMLSAITPPIAIAVVVASSIAESSFWRTAWESVKLGAPLFILPFVFVWKPDIIAANLTTTPLAALETLIGLVAISYGMQGEFRGILGNLLRIIVFALGAFGIFHPLAAVRWLCLGIAALFIIFSLAKGRLSKSEIPANTAQS